MQLLKLLILLALIFNVTTPISANPQLDSAARQYGFVDYNHYQRSLETCTTLMNGVNTNYTIELMVKSDMWNINKCNTVVEILNAEKPSSPTRPEYSAAPSGTDIIERAINDEIFIINDEVFEARTYCFGMREGDRVKFTKGSRFGACATAEFVNLRNGKICKVWCE